jgi:hypothetical protein
MELRMSAPMFRGLHEQLLAASPDEGAAFIAAEPAANSLVARSTRVFERHELDPTGFGELELTEEAQVNALADLKRRGHTLVEVHTHPGSTDRVTFSAFDQEQLPAFARYVQNKLRSRSFGALVLGQIGYAGIFITEDREEPLTLRVIGERSELPEWLTDLTATSSLEARFDRQVRALGPAGQRRIASLRVAVVGLGGTGSQVGQQLAHLGCSVAVLADDDRIEDTNLPRLAGAAWWDPWLRRRKTASTRRLIGRVNPRAQVTVVSSLRAPGTIDALKGVDLLIGCVDNDGARLVLCELASAYLIPYLDVGVGIEATNDGASVIGGRVAFYLPHRPCLACADEIDFAEAGEDLESEVLSHIRVRRGYAEDRRIEPALMPLNTVLVGMAMIELLAFTTGFRPVVPFSRYDAVGQRVVVQTVETNRDCAVCQPALGMGDRQGVDRYALAAD